MNKIDFIERKYFDKDKNEHVLFNDILKNDISIILGEPASGKTFQLEEFNRDNKNSEFIELVTLDLATDIIDEEIEVVLLDSIDEALSKTDSDKRLKKLLITYIQECKKINPNVKFVISCRFVEWKEQFEEALKKLDKELKVLYIEDLTKEEINGVLDLCEIDQPEFWEFIESSYLNELLKNIMMVIHIIEHFQEYKNSELKYVEIYKSIISEHLLFKTDNERCSNLDNLNLEDRYKIASIIAIYMVLNRKRDISIDDFDRLSNEMYKLEGIDLTGEKLKIVFDTSLFKGELGNTRFIHKSIQEYLSAYFIIEKRLDIKTIKKIFAYDTSFFEEFEEVIIYLTNIEENFFKHFISFDPIIFRRHPYLNINQQKQLFIEMLKTVQENGHKLWSKWEYLDDSSLVRYKNLDDISSIVLEKCDLSNIEFGEFSFLSGVLKNNYSQDLEDIVFSILETKKTNKRNCIEFISSNYIDNNFNYNNRLFEFLKNNDLIMYRDRVSLKVFRALYKKRNFSEIKILLRYFSSSIDRESILLIDVNDISHWLNEILSTYSRHSDENLSSKQVSFLIFQVLKNSKDLIDRSILTGIFNALMDCKIYDIKFDRYEENKDIYILDFDDIKEEFSVFFFKKYDSNPNYFNLIRILKFYELDLKHVKEFESKYPIEEFKEQYLYLKRLDNNIEEYLMKNSYFKEYIDDLIRKNDEQNRKWNREDRPHRKLEKKREKTREYSYKKAVKNLKNDIDMRRIFFRFYDEFNEDTIALDNKLKEELKDRYNHFINTIEFYFKEDTCFNEYKNNFLNSPIYYNSYIYNYLFEVKGDKYLNNIIKDENDYEKLFFHLIRRHYLNKEYFRKLTNRFNKKAIELIVELFKLSIRQSEYTETILTHYGVIEFLESMNLYNKENLYLILEEIKNINIEKFNEMEYYTRGSLLKVLTLDEQNYDFIKSLLEVNRINSKQYFKYLFSLNINLAFEEYKVVENMNDDFYLKFSDISIIHKIKNFNKFNKFDNYNISPLQREKFKTLVGIIYYRHENTFAPVLENLSDCNMEFILDRYYKMFKEYEHPLGVYSPDIYDEMSHLISKLFSIMGENETRLGLLNKLKSSDSPMLAIRAKYQIDNIKNLQLKNREHKNQYYKDIIDSYEFKKEVFFNYKQLEDDLVEISLILLESRHSIFGEEEDLINDRFKALLKAKKYDVLDQSRGGESESGKKVGERDLVIANSISNVVETVLEGFILKSNTTAIVLGHYEKLINKYDVYGNKKNYMLAYCKVKNFNNLCNNYKTHFDSFQEVKTSKENLFLGSTKIGNMEIIHLLINFYSYKE